MAGQREVVPGRRVTDDPLFIREDTARMGGRQPSHPEENGSPRIPDGNDHALRGGRNGGLSVLPETYRTRLFAGSVRIELLLAQETATLHRVGAEGSIEGIPVNIVSEGGRLVRVGAVPGIGGISGIVQARVSQPASLRILIFLDDGGIADGRLRHGR